MTQSLNLAGPLREALVDNGPLAAILGVWEGEPSVHTRRPAPSNATYPMIIISPDIAIGNRDVLVSRRPLVTRDISIFGQQPDQYRDVEDAGYLVRELFHRNKWAIVVPDYSVVEIIASGPFEGPTDDKKLLARVVSLAIQLAR